MPLLASAVPSRLDNLLTIALVGFLALIVLIAVIRKAIANKKAAAAEAAAALAAAEAPAPVVAPKTAPGSAGKLKLYDTEPKTAAMLMAIVADKLGKPINELRFISIKEVQ